MVYFDGKKFEENRYWKASDEVA